MGSVEGAIFSCLARVPSDSWRTAALQYGGRAADACRWQERCLRSLPDAVGLGEPDRGTGFGGGRFRGSGGRFCEGEVPHDNPATIFPPFARNFSLPNKSCFLEKQILARSRDV